MSTNKLHFETLQLHVGQEQADPASTTHSELNDEELVEQQIYKIQSAFQSVLNTTRTSLPT